MSQFNEQKGIKTAIKNNDITKKVMNGSLKIIPIWQTRLQFLILLSTFIGVFVAFGYAKKDLENRTFDNTKQKIEVINYIEKSDIKHLEIERKAQTADSIIVKMNRLQLNFLKTGQRRNRNETLENRKLLIKILQNKK